MAPTPEARQHGVGQLDLLADVVDLDEAQTTPRDEAAGRGLPPGPAAEAVPFPVLDVGGHDGLDLRVGPRPRHRGTHLLVLEEATERGAVVGRDRPTDEPVGAGRAARAHGVGGRRVEAWLIVEMASERWRA